jgi:hypothetical protein
MLAYSSLTSLDLGSNVRQGKDREGGSEENYIMMLVLWQVGRRNLRAKKTFRLVTCRAP